MKTLLPLLLALLAVPAHAQSRTYTNADLGRPLPMAPPASPEILEAMAARQFALPPQLPSGPSVIVIGDGRATAGPWEWPPEAFGAVAPLAWPSEQFGGLPYYSGGVYFARNRYRSPRISSVAIAPAVGRAARSGGVGRAVSGRR